MLNKEIDSVKQSEIKISIGGIETFDKHYLTSIGLLLDKIKELKDSPNTAIYYTLPLIMLSVSFLEAFINHLYYSLKDFNFYKADFEELDRKLITDLYKDFDIEKASILDKYYYLLKYCKQINIRSVHEYELVKKVIDLRNLLVHSKPYSVDSGAETEDDKIADLLKGEYELENVPTTINLRWQNYLNYNGACWIFHSSIDFFAYFWHELLPTKTTPFYDMLEKILQKHPKPLKPKKYKHEVVKNTYVLQRDY